MATSELLSVASTTAHGENVAIDDRVEAVTDEVQNVGAERLERRVRRAEHGERANPGTSR